MVCDDTDSRSHVGIGGNDVDQLVKLEPDVNDHELELTLHTLLTQANDHQDPSDPLHCAIEKAISEMELPEMMVDSPGDWTPLGDERELEIEVAHNDGSDERDICEDTANVQLTVDNILADHALHGFGGKSKKRAYEEEPDEQDEAQADVSCDTQAEQPQQSRTVTSTAYETLSPASLSPISDSESQYKHKKPGFKKPTTAATLTQRIHTPLEPPSKFTNEFTMAQVTDVKKRIINTHKLLLNFNFLKDGYARTSVELKRTLLRLKQSEIHRAQLLQENEQLKRLVIEQSEKLETHNTTK
ncbi:LANO_0G08196g1_1 [Lachancea nothofagi CBS 11611]|uniref:LANO_0G08196g1_1 n=1 Tax=Lachancea nothofagi CBS 11611 TaxID=1266666 RepID=A0A1G4KI64_9SACH|nr:LANO_0G08196g1_1 [Lachancea nothofagi CBS 11611]